MTLILAPAAIDLCAHVLVAVRTPIPVPAKLSKANKSCAKAKVGLPATPLPLVTVIPLAGAIRVLVRNPLAPSATSIPELDEVKLANDPKTNGAPPPIVPSWL